MKNPNICEGSSKGTTRRVMLFFGGLSRRWRVAIRARDPLFHCGGAALNWRREPVMQLVASLRQACFVVLFVSEEQGHSCELLKSLSEKRRHPPYRSLGRCCNNCQVKFKRPGIPCAVPIFRTYQVRPTHACSIFRTYEVRATHACSL